MSDVRKHAADQLPAAIGRYQITGSLGYGAMGAVYKAFDPRIKRQLAIKTVRLDIPRTSPQYRTFIDRFQNEAEASGKLFHPGIVTLFDIGEENGYPYFAMEFVDGKTIADVLAEGVRFKPEKVIALASQIAAALDYAHSQGVVHRDVKPANLILYEQDKVKVTDFGIAKLQDSDITHAGSLLGTPSYMSPEQAMGEKLDGRSDIFSLGVVAFEMLSGQQPFPGPNVTSILYKLVHTDPIEPADLELHGLVPHKWQEVFRKVLAKRPANRYQTASAFVQDLEYCLGTWWSGLGDGDTLTLQVVGEPVAPPSAIGDLATAAIPRAPLPPPAARQAVSALAADEETIVLAPAELAGRAEPPPATVTLVLDRSAATTPLQPPPLPQAQPPLEATVLLPPAATAIPAEATVTLPPVPPLRLPPPLPSGTAPSVAPGAPPLPKAARRGIPVPLVLGGAALLLVLLALAGWALRPREVEPVVQAEAPASTLPPATLPVAKAAPTPEPRRPAARVAPAPRPAPTTGTADVVSTPPGADVSIDGKAIGQTPLKGLKLPPGARRVELALAGYETWSSTLDVVAGESGKVDVKLRERPAPPPTPEPVDTARVYPNEQGQVDTLARKLSGQSPSYPSEKAPRLKSGQRVSVQLHFVVTETGEVADVTIVESAGKVVDDVVLAAVKGWKYEPATKRGVKVKVETSFRQTFLGA
jgi:serine/threonine-protein kinase